MEHKTIKNRIPIYMQIIVDDKEVEEEIWMASDGEKFKYEDVCRYHELESQRNKEKQELLKNVIQKTIQDIKGYFSEWFLFQTELEFLSYACFLEKKREDPKKMESAFFLEYKEVNFPQWINIEKDKDSDDEDNFYTFKALDPMREELFRLENQLLDREKLRY